MCRIETGMVKTEDILLRIADQYEVEVAARGGRSLTRVATLVASRGTFFVPLREGKTCTVRNLDAFRAYFSDITNWPGESIPRTVQVDLSLLGASELTNGAS